jgi:hypothetical protein
MFTIRDRKRFTWGLSLLIVMTLVNHGAYSILHWRAAARHTNAIDINVQAEGGILGHNSIGIDESSLSPSGGERFLHFSTLGQWQYQRDVSVPCPASIKNLSGQEFSSVGFMYPLEAGEKIKSFCLLRSTQTCCYGPRPQYNQYILVETKNAVAFERLSPILVRGRFFVDPKPDDGYVYRMEASSVQPVDDETPEVDPVTASRQAHLPLFDYTPLASMAAEKQRGMIPAALYALNGKTVVLAGYCVRRTRTVPSRIIVAKSWWDGVAQGEPPTIFNSVVAAPEDEQQAPPLWKPYQVFTGELQITTDPAQWSREGVIQLRHARLGVTGVTSVRLVHNGPFIPWEVELFILAMLLLRSVSWRVPGRSTSPL